MRLLKLTFWAVFAVMGLAGAYVWIWFRERYGRGGPIPVSQAGSLTMPLRSLAHPVRPMLQQFRLKPGDTVLELGPGPGYFTAEAASIVVQGGGRIVCLDLQRGMLDLLRARLTAAGATNAHPVAGDATRLPLADGTIDNAFLVTVLGEIPDRTAALRELHRVLKPDGVLSFAEHLGDPDYVFESTMIDLCRALGFTLVSHKRRRLGYTMVFQPDPGAM